MDAASFIRSDAKEVLVMAPPIKRGGWKSRKRKNDTLQILQDGGMILIGFR
jgi:hypothetical protein